jgi:glutamate carboxypeptidase
LKIARKGWGIYQMKVTGKAAHAGNDPEKGVSAIMELAQQTVHLQSLTRLSEGINVNVGMVRGGSRPNVIPDEAEAVIDIRVRTAAEADIVKQFFAGIRKFDPRTELEISGGMNRPPLEKTPANRSLFQIACQTGKDLGMFIDGVEVGGASDGNFTSALGIPTLDGLGSVGEGPHALHEHVVVDEMVPRTVLLANLMERIFEVY